MTDVASWQHRLKAMNHANGTSNKMIQAAMLGEIRELRKQNMANERLVPTLQKRLALHKAKGKQIANLERSLAYNRKRVKELYAYTAKYQKEIAELRSKK